MVESYYNIKNGCNKWRDCFTCPLDDCQISQNALRGTRELVKIRNARLKELASQGKSIKEIARELRISERYARHIRQLTS